MVHIEMPLADESGGAEVQVDRDAPFFKQPFGDVASVPVVLAPVVQRLRAEVGLRGELQTPDLHFELRGQSGNMGHRLAPVGVAAFSDFGRVSELSRHVEDNTPLRAIWEFRDAAAGGCVS